MKVAWICPVCGHVNNHAPRGELYIASCDDPQDGGCGDGPFGVKVTQSATAHRIVGLSPTPTPAPAVSVPFWIIEEPSHE